MERLMEDAANIKHLLPWINSGEIIIDFMRKIPLDKSHLRNQLTIRYFLKERDSHGDGFEKSIEDDAREIVIVLPGTSYKEIKDRLAILGNMPSRKEVVLRQLLHEKGELDRIVREIDSNSYKKRKSEPHNEVFDLNSNDNETNIKIKIRKREGSLEVVSSIKQEKTSPVKVASSTISPSPINEATSSSTSITSSTSHSESSSPDSTVPSKSTVDNNDPCPEFTDILNKLIENNLPSSSGTTGMPIKCSDRSSVPSLNNNANGLISNNSLVEKHQDVENNKKQQENELPSVIAENSKNSASNTNDKDSVNGSKFNLVDFIKEMTLASENKILRLCKKLSLDINVRPDNVRLNFLLNKLFDNVIDVDTNSSDTDSNETEEYSFPEELPMHFGSNTQNNTNVAVFSSLNPTVKEFKLKEPILKFANVTRSPPKPVIQGGNSSSSIIQPSRLVNISDQINRIKNSIHARPVRFMIAEENNKISAAEKPIPQAIQVPVDLTLPENNKFPINPIEEINLAEAGPSAVQKEKKKIVNETISLAQPGPSVIQTQENKNVDETVFLRLIEMFPEACPTYIRNLCKGKVLANFDDIVTDILSAENYPKRPQRVPSPVKEVDAEEQFEIVKELLPDADPDYLRMQCEKYANDDKGLKQFINQAMEFKGYPTMKDYLRKQQLSAQQKQYTSEFSIEKFVELFPDPAKSFNESSRTIKIDAMTSHYLTIFFRNKYDKISARVIHQTLLENSYKAIPSNKIFLNMISNNQVMKTRRKPTALPDNMQNIPLLQELAYINYQSEIERYLETKREEEEFVRLETKKNGLMQTCQCCYDDEVMPKDTFNCPNGCKFCKECIQRSCEVAFGEGKLIFPCLADCSSEFTLQTLQSVLPPKMFSKLAQKKALDEIKAAGIEDLAMCPFCDFASIPNEGDKIFRCLNPDCMKESCRFCKEPNHVPLKCEEVEKDEHVKARTHIEDAMTKALIRKCWKCGTSFFKEEGCNKMTCSCGAQMCYICQSPVRDYSHFNGIGGDKFDLCPLYSDTNLVNQQNVMNAAAAAKAEIDPSHLIVDPTVDVVNHYTNRRKELPQEPHMELIRVNQNPVIAQRQHYNIHHRHNQPFNLQRMNLAHQRQHHHHYPNNLPHYINHFGNLPMHQAYNHLQHLRMMHDNAELHLIGINQPPVLNYPEEVQDLRAVPNNPEPNLEAAENNLVPNVRAVLNNLDQNARAVQNDREPNMIAAHDNNPAQDVRAVYNNPGLDLRAAPNLEQNERAVRNDPEPTLRAHDNLRPIDHSTPIHDVRVLRENPEPLRVPNELHRNRIRTRSQQAFLKHVKRNKK